MKKDVFKISGSFATAKNVADNNEQVSDEDKGKNVDFEAALAATGFGKFNIFLLLIAIPGNVAPLLESTTMSLVFPAAQCDLDLSLQNKGTLNAITYLGMITSGLFWGFLADTLGRKKLLVIGYFSDALLVLCSGFSQSFNMLVTFKYFGGFIINGPFAVLTSYISEFHSAKYRAKVQLAMGLVFSGASLFIPLGAWAIFQTSINIKLFEFLSIYNWNVFLFTCSLPSLIAGIAFCFMPESPKFLMTMGRNEEALKVFRNVYAKNTGKHADSYPVKSLVDEIKLNENVKGHITANRSKTQAIKEGWQQLRPLFMAPYRFKVVQICLILTLMMSGLNTIRLWLHQIFVAIVNYQKEHDGATSSLCNMLSMVQPNVTIVDGNKICEVDVSSISPYINSMIVSTACFIGYFLAVVIVNKVRKKFLLVMLSAISLVFSFGLYFANGTTYTLIFTSIFQSCAGVGVNLLISITVEIFPTTLRTITISLAMLSARVGALTGNMVLPLLLNAGCLPTFALEGALFSLATLLSLLLPKTDQKPLE